MRVTKQSRTRNRAVTALLLPAIVFVMVVGWALYWIGHQKEGTRKAEPAPEENNVTLIPAVVLEDSQEISA